MVNIFGFVVNYTKYGIIRDYIYRIGYKINDTKLKIRKKEMDAIIPSVLTGIKLRVAGRLMTQRFYRRVRNKEFQRGSLTRNNAKLVTLARFSSKNRRGAYSITVTSGYSILD
jgi:Mitochondrial ribosomal protein (VAR1)